MKKPISGSYLYYQKKQIKETKLSLNEACKERFIGSRKETFYKI